MTTNSSAESGMIHDMPVLDQGQIDALRQYSAD
jgi:hypothetical protein